MTPQSTQRPQLWLDLTCLTNTEDLDLRPGRYANPGFKPASRLMMQRESDQTSRGDLVHPKLLLGGLRLRDELVGGSPEKPLPSLPKESEPRVKSGQQVSNSIESTVSKV
jgi:hypothetical protein